MISRLLVANRGEIARRVIRTCRGLGISPVAVYSDPDAGARHVSEADLAVRLPGARADQTYLRIDALVEAAQRTGADAVHPGYGFLSENAGFARAVLAAGLVWVGPPADAIEAMGSKVAAKKLVAAAGVPVLEELDPSDVDPSRLPILVKASAGGGGRGMRVVRDLAGLAEAVRRAGAEAERAFGDGGVFCEPYLEGGRHIEVQVLADSHGTVWSLGERECSLQRRHQKILEETPSPFVDPPLRAELGAAATEAVRAIGYVGAGTVEFLAAPHGGFFFLETNTRLQVEHPVTECVTGLDLVAEQIRLAEGARLGAEPPPATGHAIEVRLYAEDPAKGWRPQPGTLHRLDVPGIDAEFAVPAVRPGLRCDSGVVGGDEVSVHYDPMLAKVIAVADSRDEAARRLAAALAAARIHGVTTNRDLLVRVLRHPAFLAGQTDTAFFERHDLPTLAAPLATEDAVRLSALAAAADLRGGVEDPRGGGSAPDFDGVSLVAATPGRVVLDVAGIRQAFEVATYEDLVCVDSPLGAVALRPRH